MPIHELLVVVVSRRFSSSYKREFIESVVLESSTTSFVIQSFAYEDSFVRVLSVQLWSVNQWTTDTEEVTDS
jgi:hypothetical protein